MQIPFNKAYFTGKETSYIQKAGERCKLSGDGDFTKECQSFFERKYGFKRCFLTTSCTDALEMAAILLNIGPGDEVIMPSYTFVSTANAFILRGARVVFADSRKDHPGVNEEEIEKLISEKTKAIVVVHYAGIACDMDKIVQLAEKCKLFIVEDAAQAIDAFYHQQALGTIGHLSAFSFHETKNITSGEGGMLVVNDERFIERAEIIREKGTNRNKFFRGEVDRYNWVDIGSSFLPSEITAAFLYAQIEQIDMIQQKRKMLWDLYYEELQGLKELGIMLPAIPRYASHNAHAFYLVCKNIRQRDELLSLLRHNSILAVFHYQSLHKSPYYLDKHDGRELVYADKYSDCLVRLPMYFELTREDITGRITPLIRSFFSA